MTKSFNQSIASNDTLLILCCQVSSKLNAPDFVIQWHQSATIPIATNKTSANENTAIEETDRAEMTVNSRKIVWSKLRIDTLTYKESDGGYFWCSVNNDNNTFIPSYVLNISSIENVQLQTCGCDDGLIVVDNTQFYSRCANSDVHIINDIQSDKCPQGEDGKLSQSTNATEDLWTTASSQIDINNGSTIQEVKGLTTLPTKAPNNDKSTTHHTNVQITNEKIYEDITQATSAADTKWLTTAETSKKGQLESVMMSFTIGKPPSKIFVIHKCTCSYTALFPIHRYQYGCYTDLHTESHNWSLHHETFKDEIKTSKARG